MKKLLLFFLFLVISLAARSQAIQFTASVPHTNGTPSGTPSTQGSRLRYDKTNQILYQWTGSAWTRVIGVITDGDKGDLTVSSSGTNWQLDAGSVGNTEIASGAGGVYKGSGTIPAGAAATAAGDFTIARASGGQMWIKDDGGYFYATTSAGLSEAAATESGAVLSVEDIGSFSITPTGAFFDDVRLSNPRGLQYVSDYSATYNDRSLPDWGSVKAMVSDSIATVSGGGGGSSYLVYTALLSQSGTSAPTATVLENTLGGSITWVRNSTGDYSGTLTGAFVLDKTWVSCTLAANLIADEMFGFLRREDANTVNLVVRNDSISHTDGFQGCSIEIRVYP